MASIPYEDATIPAMVRLLPGVLDIVDDDTVIDQVLDAWVHDGGGPRTLLRSYRAALRQRLERAHV